MLSHAQIIGGYASDFFDFGVGARYLAMGSAGRTIARDSTAGYWNSALLPYVRGLSFSGMSASLLGLTKYDQYAISLPLSPDDIFSINYVGFRVDGLEIHGKTSAITAEPEGYFNVYQNAFFFSYGREIVKDMMSLGLTAKYGERAVYSSKDSVVAVDLGVLMALYGFNIGGNIRNVYASTAGDTSDKYPLDFDLGISTKLFGFTFSADLSRILRKSLLISLGTEYSLFDDRDNFDVKLRAGYNSNTLSLGLGTKLAPLYFDYAYLFQNTDQTHVFSLGIDFTDNSQHRNLDSAETYFKRVREAIQIRNLNSAHEIIKEGVKEYPSLFVMRKLHNHIEKAVAFSKITADIKTDANGVRILDDSLFEYLKDNFDIALDNVEYLNQKHNITSVKKMRNTIEQDSNKVSKYKGKNIIDEYLSESLASLVLNKLDESKETLERILYLEPENTTALKRLGSNLFLEKKTDEAIALWEKALKIDPDDIELLELLNKGKMNKTDFADIKGISNTMSEQIYLALRKSGILIEKGIINRKVDLLTKPLGLPANLMKFEAAIRALLIERKMGESK